MQDTFAARVKSAASAAWWTALLWTILLTVSWFGAMWIMSARPEWARSLIGDFTTWEELGRVYLWGIGIFKIFWWIWIFGAVFLTIWARKLQKAGV